jgi:nanoRNase/pAp phosphatase (c-di-AMP/oligoRNAs hydrolase)
MNRFEKDLESVLRQSYEVRLDKISDHPIPILNASGMFASEAGNTLAEKSPSKMAIIWTMHKDGLKLMLRSSVTGPDVARICKRFWNGGGHVNAAGATLIDPDEIRDFLFHIIPAL